MLRHDFCRSDGRLLKLLLSSTLVDKSPLTFIYFTTFEKKRRVRSPLSTQPNFLVFGKINVHFLRQVKNYLCFVLSQFFSAAIASQSFITLSDSLLEHFLISSWYYQIQNSHIKHNIIWASLSI